MLKSHVHSQDGKASLYEALQREVALRTYSRKFDAGESREADYDCLAMADLQKLEEAGFLASMLQVCERGIDVTVVTDKRYNTSDKGYEKRKEKQQNLTAAPEQLEGIGIATRFLEPNAQIGKIVVTLS